MAIFSVLNHIYRMCFIEGEVRYGFKNANCNALP